MCYSADGFKFHLSYLNIYFFHFIFWRKELRLPLSNANKSKMTSGQGWGSTATTGAPIVTSLPKILQHPYAVASMTVGNNYALIKYATSNAETMPRLVMSIRPTFQYDELYPVAIS